MRRLAPWSLLLVVASLVAPAPDAAYDGAPWFRPGFAYDQNFPDPSVVYDPTTGGYYAYATTTGGAYVPAMSSSDATTWRARDAYPGGTPPCVPFEDRFYNDALPCPSPWAPVVHPGSRLPREIWSPGAARIGGRWVLWYAVRETLARQRFCLTVAVSDEGPLGPFTDAHPGPLQCDADPNGSIDPQPFVDPATGTPYLAWKSEGVPGSAPTRIWVRQLRPDGLAFAAGSTARAVLGTTGGSWEGNVIESPSMVSYGGRWLLFYSANEWDSAAYAIGMATCDSPLGPCTKSPQNPILRTAGSIVGPGGPSAFVDGGGALRLAHHFWTAPHVGYPTDPGCDGRDPLTNAPLCASQGQRRMRVTFATVRGSAVTISTTPTPGPPARSIDSACPSGPVAVPVGPYPDVPADASAARAIDCMSDWGVIGGQADGRFVPNGSTTRGQLASMVVRLLERTTRPLPAAGPGAFGDDDGSVHEANIDRLAAAGIVGGTGPGTFAPNAPVSRAQVATIVARTADWVGDALPAGPDVFADDDLSPHRSNIDAAAAAGIATGTGSASFSPLRDVTRAQVATFLARLADLLVDRGAARPPSLGG